MSASSQEKSQTATAHHRQEAQKKGQFWDSPDVRSAWSLLIAGALGWFAVPLAIKALVVVGETAWTLNTTTALSLALELLGRDIVILVATLLIVNIAATVTIRGFRLTFKAPWHPEKLNPITGVTHLFSRNTLWELGKGLIKLTVMMVVAVLWFQSEKFLWSALITAPLAESLPKIGQAIGWGWIEISASYGLLSIGDVWWQKKQHEQQLKMTKQEVRDENKEMEGSAENKQRQHQMRRQLGKTQAQAVASAAVVITNPTHFAVALAWTLGQDTPPIIVAKGHDEWALAIRAQAADANVPIMEDPPLARHLYTLPLNTPVPEDSWRAVAVILAYLMHIPSKEP